MWFRGRELVPASDLTHQVAKIIFEAEWEPLEWDEDTTGSEQKEYLATADRIIKLVQRQLS